MKSIVKELLGWIVYIIIIIGLAYLIITFVGQRTQVSGSSMETTLASPPASVIPFPIAWAMASVLPVPLQ